MPATDARSAAAESTLTIEVRPPEPRYVVEVRPDVGVSEVRHREPWSPSQSRRPEAGKGAVSR
jgi:hypothetical protein